MIFVVDLDGTLVKNDLFKELLFLKLVSSPLAVLYNFFKKGILGLKYISFENYIFSVDQIMINYNVLNLIEQKRALGYTIVLATASPQVYADFVAENWSVFDKVFGSDNKCNLKGQKKLNLIISISEGQKFEYVGDSKIDNIIFKSCSNYYKIINHEVYKFAN